MESTIKSFNLALISVFFFQMKSWVIALFDKFSFFFFHFCSKSLFSFSLHVYSLYRNKTIKRISNMPRLYIKCFNTWVPCLMSLFHNSTVLRYFYFLSPMTKLAKNSTRLSISVVLIHALDH